MKQIPLSQVPAQTFSIVLGRGAAGIPCTCSLYWRQERLYLDLAVGDSPVCRGCVCQNRASIVQPRSRLFPGSLHFFDLEGDLPPHWEQLHTGTGGRWMLLHVEDGEEIPGLLRW